RRGGGASEGMGGTLGRLLPKRVEIGAGFSSPFDSVAERMETRAVESRCCSLLLLRVLEALGLIMEKSISRSWLACRLGAMFPLKQKLMVPRSSLTITTTASVSSVMPKAARCREPKLDSKVRFSGMGKKT